MNLTELLDNTARQWPQQPALVEDSTIVSYAQLVEKVDQFAARLKALRVSPGSRVGLCYPNSVNYVALTFALWRINAIVVPVPMECAEEELAAIAETMQLEAVLSQKPREQSAALSPDCFFTPLMPATPADNHGLNIALQGRWHQRGEETIG